MTTMFLRTARHLRKFLLDDSGPTAVEYAVMLALIIAVCLGAIMSVGQQTADLWSSNDSGIQSAFNQ